MKNKLYFLLFFALISFSCTKLEKFSDANAVTSFTVTSHSPEEIVIDNVRIEGDTIFIPVVYGKYQFPLRFRAKLTTSPDINKIVGADFAKEQELGDINARIKFHVVAQSGATRTYFISPREIPLDENNYIYGDFSFKAADENLLISPFTRYEFDEGTLQLSGIELKYPVTMTPRFSIAPTSRFDMIWQENGQQTASPFENGVTEITFGSAETKYFLRVISQSGLAKVWEITLQNCRLLDSGEQPSQGASALFVDPRSLIVSSAQNGLTINETRVDEADGSIVAIVGSSASAPLKINFTFPASDLVDLIDMKRDTVLTFSAYNEIKTFYILDPLTKTAKKWTISLKKEQSNLNQVLSFTYGYDAGLIHATPSGQPTFPSIVMDPAKVNIYPQERQIVLVYTSFQADDNAVSPNLWSCTLKNISVTLSEGATTAQPLRIEWKATAKSQASALLGQMRTFDVTAEDGTVATWSIKLTFEGVSKPSDECNVNSMTIDRIIPNYTQLESNPVAIDHDNRRIIIKLANDDGSYPMQIFASYTLSDYASLASQSGGTLPLVFADASSTQTITVVAQDGTRRDYNVSLQSLVKADGAEITGIDFGAITPAGFTITADPTFDSQNGTIILHLVSDDVAFPLNMAYNSISLTPYATMSISERGKFTFNKSTDQIPISVRAQNGNTKMWNLKLDYRPQLRNWNLNSWSGNTPQSTGYWATANNTFGTGTKSGAGSSGSSGDLAAYMTTASIIGKLAAGTIFNGTFDSGNILAGLSDPVSLTFFGIPFAPTAKIKGILVDVWYHPGAVDQDWGSAAINLINWNGAGTYVFHGDKPGKTPADASSPHPKNTAVIAAIGTMKFGTGSAISKYGDTVMVLTDSQWKKDVFIPVDGSVKFTHISVVFSSSAYGDYYTGVSGSVLRVDNIRIEYE